MAAMVGIPALTVLSGLVLLVLGIASSVVSQTRSAAKFGVRLESAGVLLLFIGGFVWLNTYLSLHSMGTAFGSFLILAGSACFLSATTLFVLIRHHKLSALPQRVWHNVVIYLLGCWLICWAAGSLMLSVPAHALWLSAAILCWTALLGLAAVRLAWPRNLWVKNWFRYLAALLAMLSLGVSLAYILLYIA